jgi:hypothetical protein
MADRARPTTVADLQASEVRERVTRSSRGPMSRATDPEATVDAIAEVVSAEVIDGGVYYADDASAWAAHQTAAEECEATVELAEEEYGESLEAIAALADDYAEAVADGDPVKIAVVSARLHAEQTAVGHARSHLESARDELDAARHTRATFEADHGELVEALTGTGAEERALLRQYEALATAAAEAHGVEAAVGAGTWSAEAASTAGELEGDRAVAVGQRAAAVGQAEAARAAVYQQVVTVLGMETAQAAANPLGAIGSLDQTLGTVDPAALQAFHDALMDPTSNPETVVWQFVGAFVGPEDPSPHVVELSDRIDALVTAAAALGAADTRIAEVDLALADLSELAGLHEARSAAAEEAREAADAALADFLVEHPELVPPDGAGPEGALLLAGFEAEGADDARIAHLEQLLADLTGIDGRLDEGAPALTAELAAVRAELGALDAVDAAVEQAEQDREEAAAEVEVGDDGGAVTATGATALTGVRMASRLDPDDLDPDDLDADDLDADDLDADDLDADDLDADDLDADDFDADDLDGGRRPGGPVRAVPAELGTGLYGAGLHLTVDSTGGLHAYDPSEWSFVEDAAGGHWSDGSGARYDRPEGSVLAAGEAAAVGAYGSRLDTAHLVPVGEPGQPGGFVDTATGTYYRVDGGVLVPDELPDGPLRYAGGNAPGGLLDPAVVDGAGGVLYVDADFGVLRATPGGSVVAFLDAEAADATTWHNRSADEGSDRPYQDFSGGDVRYAGGRWLQQVPGAGVWHELDEPRYLDLRHTDLQGDFLGLEAAVGTPFWGRADLHDLGLLIDGETGALHRYDPTAWSWDDGGWWTDAAGTRFERPGGEPLGPGMSSTIGHYDSLVDPARIEVVRATDGTDLVVDVVSGTWSTLADAAVPLPPDDLPAGPYTAVGGDPYQPPPFDAAPPGTSYEFDPALGTYRDGSGHLVAQHDGLADDDLYVDGGGVPVALNADDEAAVIDEPVEVDLFEVDPPVEVDLFEVDPPVEVDLFEVDPPVEVDVEAALPEVTDVEEPFADG